MEIVADVGSRVNRVLEVLINWIESAGLKLATEKTEVILITADGPNPFLLFPD